MTKPSTHSTLPGSEPRRRIPSVRNVLIVGAGTVLVAALIHWAWPSRVPEPPQVDTHGLQAPVSDAIDEAVAAVRGSPRSGQAWGRLASLLMQYEFMEEARAAFKQAARLNPREPRWPYLHGILLMNQNAPAAIKEFERAVALSGNSPDAPRLRLAQFLAEHGRTAEAERQFELLLRHAPGHAPAALGLAQIRYSQDRPADCTNLLQRCLSDPHTARSACALLSAVLLSSGRPVEAEAAARRGATLSADAPWPDPFWAEAALLRVDVKARIEAAALLLDQGRLADATEALKDLVRQRPGDDEPWYLLGWALNQQQDGPGAEGALREHLRLSPRSPKGLAQLGVALLIQRRLTEAVPVLEEAAELKPTWRELHSNLGYASVQLGREAVALGHYRNAVAQDPGHVPTLTSLAELLLRRGDRVEAREWLLQALALDPANERAQALLNQAR